MGEESRGALQLHGRPDIQAVGDALEGLEQVLAVGALGRGGEGSVAAGDGGVEAFVAVVQVRAEGIALPFPEGVAGVVVAEDKAEDLLDALLP